MSDSSGTQGGGPAPENGDHLEVRDQVMLAVLAHRRREAVPLSQDQERLLDEWIEGSLPTGSSERAVELVQNNIFAVERVLERQLVRASNEGPEIPAALSQRVLGKEPVRIDKQSSRWRWPVFSFWQWSLSSAVAATVLVAAIGLRPFEGLLQGTHPLEVAMASLDRTALFEPSDIRMRGGRDELRVTSTRFRDVEVPTSVLRRLIAIATGDRSNVDTSEILPLLDISESTDARPPKLFLDSVLAERLREPAAGERLTVRIYNLEDPRTADIKSKIDSVPSDHRSFLLTLKP